MSENVLVLGGSRNIGYHAALRLLAAGATVTFLLRSTSVFDNDEVVQGYIKSGKARLIKGDGLIKDDVKRAWEESGRDRPVDTVVFTVGGKPKFHVTKGFVLDPPNLVAMCFLNLITTMPQPSEANPNQLKMIVITSLGLTPSTHQSLPLLLRPVYSYLLDQPHKDKLGVERLAFHCMGREWPTGVPEPAENIMGSDWANREGLPKFGSFSNVIIVRPALLTDGECVADKLEHAGKKKPYRVGSEEISGYTVSRKDVAHFIVEDALKNWEKYRDTIATIVY